ncbi:MAG: hypothetical protein HN353_11565 [Bdellovibrionales bacterium]|jgi:hypothetical protein|nr:hypothetical protein [Bdellovibrionales bacterium]MBT3526786.1 hypothetical protein [Bdellovibrionales bacterium]MBT7668343.1 hypothetical protein [Bdellovibrionales bacterium]MBT7766911.1 hypothetical protein [Bdellovibrionales bacterium]
MQSGVKWFVFLVLLLPTTLVGAEITVEELANGACWAGVSRQGELRVVSFNQRSAFNLMEHWQRELIYQVRAELTSLEVDPRAVSYSSYLHCSGMGHALVLNLQDKGRSFCLWGRWDSEQQEMEQIFFGGSVKQDGAPCWGHRLGELIVGFNGESSELISLLEQPSLKPIVIRVVPITKSVVKLILHPDYFLLELEALEEVKQIIGAESVRYGELNNHQWGVGEFMLVK